MNFKTTIALLVLLAGLGVYLLETQHSSTSSDTTVKPTEAKKLVDMKPEDVSKVSVTASDGKVTSFEKTGVDWQMTEPMQTSADNSLVDQLLQTVTGLTSQGQLDASQKSANGLDHPSFTIALTTKDKTTKLLVGDRSLGNTLAVLLDGSDQPNVVDVSLYSSLDKKPSSYRKTRLISTGTENIRQVEITRAGKETVRLQKIGDTWQITAPNRMPADSSAVDSIVSAITNLNAAGFDDIDTPADAGLVKPRIAVWFSTVAPTTQSTTEPTSRPAGTTIKLGGFENVSEKNILASVDDGPIVTLPASTIDSFRKTALDLRDKVVLNIDPDRVESFSLQSVAGPTTRPATTQPATTQSLAASATPHDYEIERRKQNHALGPVLPTTSTTAPTTQPLSTWDFKSGGDADDTQAKALLDALHPLRAEDFIAHPVPATQPAGSYTLTVHAGPGAGSAPQDYTLQITDPGGDQKLIGFSDGLTFDLARSVLPPFQAEFKPKK
jgi:hypothetical protein